MLAKCIHKPVALRLAPTDASLCGYDVYYFFSVIASVKDYSTV